MASVKLKIKGERSVVVMIFDNVPSFLASIYEIGGAKQAEELTKS